MWHWYLNLRQKIKLKKFKSEVEIKEIKMDELSVMKFKSEVEIEEFKMDELSVMVKIEN